MGEPSELRTALLVERFIKTDGLNAILALKGFAHIFMLKTRFFDHSQDCNYGRSLGLDITSSPPSQR